MDFNLHMSMNVIYVHNNLPDGNTTHSEQQKHGIQQYLPDNIEIDESL